MLESYPNPQKSLSLRVCNEKSFGDFEGDVISGVIFLPFWLRLPGPGLKRQMEVFRSSFCWKLG